MDITSIIGNIAAALTTISFLPQAIKTIRTKDTASLSFPMYCLFVSGISMWLAYGLLNQQMPIILGNLVTLILAGIFLVYMIREGFHKNRKPSKPLFKAEYSNQTN